MKIRLDEIVKIPVGKVELEGELTVPPTAKGLVIFAHGSGSSRHSPRNRFVARELHKSALATLLVDLLTEEEDKDFTNRFDIALLAKRLAKITDWALNDEQTKGLNIGYFGASTGAAAAMFASRYKSEIKAIVSRGGRVDLAAAAVDDMRAPMLLIVGEKDFDVLEANKVVYSILLCQKKLSIVPKATHLFEERGALDRVAELATEWFLKYLA